MCFFRSVLWYSITQGFENDRMQKLFVFFKKQQQHCLSLCSVSLRFIILCVLKLWAKFPQELKVYYLNEQQKSVNAEQALCMYIYSFLLKFHCSVFKKRKHTVFIRLWNSDESCTRKPGSSPLNKLPNTYPQIGEEQLAPAKLTVRLRFFVEWNQFPSGFQ